MNKHTPIFPKKQREPPSLFMNVCGQADNKRKRLMSGLKG